MTLIVASDDGVTHSPPMKKRSVCRIGTLMSFAEAHLGALSKT